MEVDGMRRDVCVYKWEATHEIEYTNQGSSHCTRHFPQLKGYREFPSLCLEEETYCLNLEAFQRGLRQLLLMTCVSSIISPDSAALPQDQLYKELQKAG